MLDRLNQVMDHIEQRLDEPLDIAELARIATTSEYHLRRMFSALAGMPLSEYVRRRRPRWRAPRSSPTRSRS